jgi:uncharacterized protein YjbI with pentapeptide repeats
MKRFADKFKSALLTAIFLSGTLAALGQRSFNVSIALTNSGAAISWKAQSATPNGDLFVIPQFLVERSPDLVNWTPVSGILSASLDQRVTFADTNNALAFYRVQSIIDLEYAHLDNVTPDGGQLASADFFGAELFGASLQQADLPSAEFPAADVRQADFANSDLAGADFFAAFGLEAVFDESVLTGADLSFANFEAGSFFDVDLTGADLSSATLDSADFDFALFKNVTLDSNTVIDAKPKLIWQIINAATNGVLTNLDLSSANLTGANLRNANLSGSGFFNSFLDDADLRGANFTNADLSFVDFRGAQMDATTIINSESRLVWQILNQNFGAGRDLHGTNLSSAVILGANFISAVLTNANLTFANCASADFTGANLRNATTNGASFVGATFNNTIMPNGSIRNF